MADLTAERMARLRVWAQGGNPDCPADAAPGGCPWCGDVGPDGNAHDIALELLDEIDRLRDERARVADALRQLATDTDGRACYDALYDLADELDPEFEPDNRPEATDGS